MDEWGVPSSWGVPAPQAAAVARVAAFLRMVYGWMCAGLALWDAQRMKRMALAAPQDRLGSIAVVGALALYLDFINLFVFLLRFQGNRQE